MNIEDVQTIQYVAPEIYTIAQKDLYEKYKHDAVVKLLYGAIQAGFAANFVLMDSWFTQVPLLRSLMCKGLHVIGMIKDMKERYRVGGKRMTLKELHQ